MENTEHTSTSPTPRTPEEALRAVDAVRVPAALFFEWLNRLGTLPAGHVADVYVSMRQQLNDAVQDAAQVSTKA